MSSRKLKVCSVFAGLVLGSSAASLSAAEGEWDWSIALYAWMSGIDSTLSANGRDIGGIDMSFSDVVDKLDATIMLHGEGFRDHWGFFADYLYLNLSDDKKRNGGNIDASLKSSIFELAGVYRPSGSPEGFEVFAGLRYFSMDVKLDITTQDGKNRTRSDGGYTDFMVGGRYTSLITDNWFYRIRADASGGSTDGTWGLTGTAGYRFGKELNKSVLFGYRHLEIDLEDKQGALTIRNDMKMSGPFVAFNYAF